MRYIRIVVGLSGLLLACTQLLADERDRKASEYPAIGTLGEENFQSLPYMCECEFFRGPINGATTVFATRKERAVAFVMVDGRLVTLQRDGKPTNASCGKNVRHRERWVGGLTAVVLDYHATGSGAESCWFEGKMGIAVGRRRASTGVSGACGC
jgi:hypothetical protein